MDAYHLLQAMSPIELVAIKKEVLARLSDPLTFKQAESDILKADFHMVRKVNLIAVLKGMPLNKALEFVKSEEPIFPIIHSENPSSFGEQP